MSPNSIVFTDSVFLVIEELFKTSNLPPIPVEKIRFWSCKIHPDNEFVDITGT